MMAVKWEIPNMPRLETVKVPPYATTMINRNTKMRSNSDTHLVLLWLELAVASLLRERLALRRNGCETLGANILDNGRNKTGGSCHSYRNIRLLVSARN